jgi:thiol-disulfide isomerase/thioredoxin
MMKKFLVKGALAAAVACGSLALAGDSPRPADEIYAQYQGIEVPKPDPARRGDQQYMTETREKAMAALKQRAELARELYNAKPDHPEAARLMAERIQTLFMTGDPDTAQREAQELLGKITDEKAKADISFASTQFLGRSGQTDQFKTQAQEFLASYPTDKRGASLLMMLAGQAENSGEQLKLYRQVVEKYPESPAAAQAGGKIKQVEGIGKPFTISFTDAITGNAVSSESLKGKVVVVDFWATWCGPCVAEMPHMKEIYAKYKDKGVEFVGISLDAPEDQGGLTALKDYVKENQIGWPQYYQGKGWQGEFSQSWGINSIPAIFIVDQNGNLASVNARGHVEEMIEKLLKGEPVERTGG